MKRAVRRSEAGFSLVTAVIIITLLVFLGTMVLSQVANDVQLAGGDRAAMNAMYIAEAGAVLAKDMLVNGVCPSSGSGGACGTPATNYITNLPALPASYPKICPDTNNCSVFYGLLGYPTPATFNNGSYIVAVSCNPSCTGTPSSYNIRSYGSTPDGAGRLIEMTVGY